MRNYSLDVLKFLCSVVVVFLHVQTPLHTAYVPLTRFAVPCFFILSGYFLMGDNMEKRMKRGCKRMMRIIFYSSVLFAVVQLILNHINFKALFPSVDEIIEFLLLNNNPWGFHLWYLNAYLYVLLIGLVIYKRDLWTMAYYFVPILLAIDLILGKYSLLLLHMEFPYIIVRNFLFVGLPYFLIGTYIKQQKEAMCRWDEKFIWGGIIYFSFLTIFENRLLVCLGLNATRDHYLSTTPLAIFVFILFLKHQAGRPTIFSRIGQKDSLYIYIFQ